MRRISIVIALSALLFTSLGSAQQTSTTSVPNLIRYSGTLKGAQSAVPSSTVGVTFAIYKQQEGGAPIWMETQNVTPDTRGQYNVLLGSTTATGLPSDLFSEQEQRWLGIQVQGQAEQPRVMLVSVPYAFRAHEAETLGGLPASAFVKAAPPSDAVGSAFMDASTAVNAAATAGSIKTTRVAQPGTPGYIPIWLGGNNFINSHTIYQTASGSVGIGTTTPATTLEVSDPVSANIQVTSGTNNYNQIVFSRPDVKWSLGNYTDFRLYNTTNGFGTPVLSVQSTTGNVGIGTATPAAALHVEMGSGSNVLLESSAPPFNGYQLAINNSDPSETRSAIGFKTQNRNAWVIGNDYAGDNSFFIAQGGSPQAYFLVMNSVGQVGIGTATPTSALDVVGSAKLEGSGNGVIFPDGTKQTTAASGSGGVTSWNGRTGAVVPQTGDYNFSKISQTLGSSQLAGTYNQAVTLSNTSNVLYGDGSHLTGIAVHTIAGCISEAGSPPGCPCNGRLEQCIGISNGGMCQVTSDTGSCSASAPNNSYGSCTVCKPN